MKLEIPVFVLSAVLGAAGGVALKQLSHRLAPGTIQAEKDAPAASPGLGATAANGTETAAAGPATKALPQLGPGPSLEELRAAKPEDRLLLLLRWLPGADAAQVAALAGEWFAEANGSGDAVWQVLVQRWVELDAAAAIIFSRKLSDSFSRRVGMNATTPLWYAYRALGKSDPDLALSFLAEEPPGLAGRLAQELIPSVGAGKLRQWALSIPGRSDLNPLRKSEKGSVSLDLTDPAKAAASLTPEMMKYQMEPVATEWAKKDPAAALAWAKGLESGSYRAKALAAIASTLAATDPSKALELIRSLPPSATRMRAESSYLSALAQTDPQAAAAYASANLGGLAKIQGLAAVATAQAATDPAGALKLLRDQGIGDFSTLARTRVESDGKARIGFYPMRDPFKAIAVKDPAGVMQLLADTGSLVRMGNQAYYVGGTDNPSNDGYLGRSIFKDWVVKDAAAAAKWAAGQPDGEGMQELIKSAADPWFAKNPGELRAFAASLPAGEGKDSFVQATAVLMSVDDPAGALAWTSQNGGTGAVGEVFGSLAKSNPALAASQFPSMPPEVQSKQIQALTDSLGKTSPASAVSFFQSLPEDQQAVVKLYDTTIAYARQDPKAASEWIGTLPSNNARDTAISGLVDYLIKQSSDPDPEGAAYWAAASVTPDGRERRLKRVAEAWFQRDPGGAAVAIQSTDLADEVKQTLLSHAPVKK